VLEVAGDNEWRLVTSLYCIEETRRNLAKFTSEAKEAFYADVIPGLEIETTTYVIDRPMVFPVAKDRPVVASALALKCEALLTLDRADFQSLLGEQIYGMTIVTPGNWIRRWRAGPMR
jgi:hypothetical protein